MPDCERAGIIVFDVWLAEFFIVAPPPDSIPIVGYIYGYWFILKDKLWWLLPMIVGFVLL